MTGSDLVAALKKAGISQSTYYMRMSTYGVSSERALTMTKEEAKALARGLRNPFRAGYGKRNEKS